MLAQYEERMQRALLSLDGLSVGDAFGEKFFGPRGTVAHQIETRTLPGPQWRFTDDTNMALSIVSILRQYDELDQEMLAISFAYRYDPSRGYGAGMHVLLVRVGAGVSWQRESNRIFNGQGSFGNGAAMRVAPLGAYFADDIEATIENARRSAEVTHAHPEGIAGAIAIAVATALAWQARQTGKLPTRQEFLEQILPHVSDSVVSENIRHALNLAPDTSLQQAVSALGNGSGISAQDTVPSYCGAQAAIWTITRKLSGILSAPWATAIQLAQWLAALSPCMPEPAASHQSGSTGANRCQLGPSTKVTSNVWIVVQAKRV